VDLKEGFIKLLPEDTKTREGRLVPVDQEMMEMLQGMPRGLPNVPVFTFQGLAISYIKVSFTKACKRAGIEDFTFHDFRHTYVTNKCIEGHHYFRIMAATGHKTMSVFPRLTP
jgi:integrase